MDPPNDPKIIQVRVVFKPPACGTSIGQAQQYELQRPAIQVLLAMTVSLVDGGQGTFALRGRLDLSNIGDILFTGQNQFDEYENIIVDLDNADCASTAGLALLIEWSTWSAAHGKELTYTHAAGNLLVLIEVNGVHKLLQVLPE